MCYCCLQQLYGTAFESRTCLFFLLRLFAEECDITGAGARDKLRLFVRWARVPRSSCAVIFALLCPPEWVGVLVVLDKAASPRRRFLTHQSVAHKVCALRCGASWRLLFYFIFLNCFVSPRRCTVCSKACWRNLN